MARDEDLPRRIEAVFERMGLGNSADPEKLQDYLELYEQSMSTAHRLSVKKGKDFEAIIETTPPAKGEEEV